NLDCARVRIEPADVPCAVAIEIAGTEALPAGRMIADVAARAPAAVCQQPEVHIAGGRIEPGEIVGRVGIEVTEAGRYPADRVRADIDTRHPMRLRWLRSRRPPKRDGLIGKLGVLDVEQLVGAVGTGDLEAAA